MPFFSPFSSSPKRSWAVTVDPPNLPANSMTPFDVALPGLKRSMIPVISMPDLAPGITVTPRVKQAGTLELRFHNATGTAVNPPAQDLYVVAL